MPPPKGSAADSILAFAPDPWVTVQGQQKVLTFAVDVTNNILYHYDKDGNPIMGYRIASGKLDPENQTDEGLRVVSHVETYPYKTAPPHTKRSQNPSDYGCRGQLYQCRRNQGRPKTQRRTYRHTGFLPEAARTGAGL